MDNTFGKAAKAIVNSDLRTIEHLVNDFGVNYQILSYGGTSCSFLHLAAEAGAIEITRFLIRSGANLDLTRSDGNSALHIAAQSRHSDVVHALLQGGANADLLGPDGCSALHIAVESRHSDVVSALIQGGANVDLLKPNGYSALHITAEKRHIGIVSVLIQGGADVDLLRPEGISALLEAAHRGHSDVVSALIQGGANVNLLSPDGVSALKLAAQNGHSDVVSALMQGGANVDLLKPDGVSALQAAAQNGHSDVVSELIQGGANVDLLRPDGGSALHEAALRGHSDVVSVLIQRVADVDLLTPYGSSALHLAAQNRHSDAVYALIQGGANVEMLNYDGRSALYYAAISGHIGVVQAIIQGVTNIDLLGKDVISALYVAALFGYFDMFKVLLEIVDKSDTLEIYIELAVEYAVCNNSGIIEYLIQDRGVVVDIHIVIASIDSCSCRLFSYLCSHFLHKDQSIIMHDDLQDDIAGDTVQDNDKQRMLHELTRCKEIAMSYKNVPKFSRYLKKIIHKIDDEINYLAHILKHQKTMGKFLNYLNEGMRFPDSLAYKIGIVAVTDNRLLGKVIILVSSSPEKLTQIGSGSFGTVFKCNVHLGANDNVEVAIKQLNINFRRNSNFNLVMEEVNNMTELSHKNIVKLYGAHYESTDVNNTVLRIIMEFCDQDLKNYFIDKGVIKNRNPGLIFDSKNYCVAVHNAAKVMMQICNGLAYIHSKNCIHKDLKLANIMLTKDLVVKICDFGLSDFIKGEVEYTYIFKGTKVYSAPECFHGEYSPKTDCYVLGLLFYEIWIGTLYYQMDYFTNHNSAQVVEFMREGNRPTFVRPNNPPKIIQRFITSCWNQNRVVRPTALECKAKLRKIIFVLKSAIPAPDLAQKNLKETT